MARFLLVHGAMGGAWVWERVIPGLRRPATPPRRSTCPARAPIRRRWPRSPCIATPRRCATHWRPDRRPSSPVTAWAGWPITQAAARRPELVERLVYVSAFCPQPGQSLIEITQLPEAAGDSVQANITVEGDPPVATMAPEAAPEALYHCCTAEQIAWAMPQRGSQPVIPFTQPFEGPDDDAADAFAALPRAYISCLQDRAIRPPVQKVMYTAAACDPVIEIDTDHSPWLSRTDELVAALVQIAAR